MRITKYFLSMAAAVGMIAGCQKPEMVQMSPIEDVVAPVLSEVAPIEITAANLGLESVTFTWSHADYGVKTQVNYAIEVSSANHADKVVVTSGITGDPTKENVSSQVSYEALNAILLYDLELASGVAENVQFFVSAKVGESPKVYSNAVTVSASATAAEKVYPKLYIVGSYNSWSHDKNQYVFDFAGDDTVYQGLIDFGTDHASNEFKITGGGWGNDEHSMDGAHDAESKTIKLVAGGGDNINVYQAKRFYHLTFDRALTLTADVSFDQIGVIGGFNGWGADEVMEFNSAKQRFYVDVEFTEDTEFKFRLDADWSVSYGSTGTGVLDSGDNIKAAAGNYRIYLNMNNFSEMTYELNAKMYGQPEDTGASEPEQPVEPETPAAKGWALIGDFNGWGGDLAMTQNGGVWSVKDVELKAGQGWKLRKDADWADNRGAAGDVEPFEVPVGEGFAAVAGGKNLTVPADGNYDVYYHEGDELIYVLEAGADAPEFGLTWYLVGGFNSWTVGDAAYMMKKNGEYFVFKGFTLESDNEVKFNAGSWDINRGGTFSADAALEAKDGGDNFKVPAGKYDVYMDLAAETIYFMAEGKTPADAGEAVITYIDASKVVVGLSGKFSGTEEWTDPAGKRLATFVSKTLTDETKFAGSYEYKIEGFEFSNGDQFKVRINSAWIGGSDMVEGLDVSGDDNVAVNEGGTFNLKITFDWDGTTHSNVKVVASK